MEGFLYYIREKSGIFKQALLRVGILPALCQKGRGRINTQRFACNVKYCTEIILPNVVSYDRKI